MSAHTPGPWITNERPGDENAPASVVYVTSGGLAYAVAMCPKYVNPKDWIARDGALIAAAPDLLAALKDVMRSCRHDFTADAQGECDFRNAYAEQIAAIAKAEGRA